MLRSDSAYAWTLWFRKTFSHKPDVEGRPVPPNRYGRGTIGIAVGSVAPVRGCMLDISGHGGRVRVVPVGRPYPEAAGVWDRDAITARVEVAVGSVSAEYQATVWSHELAGLRSLLAHLHEQAGPTPGMRIRYLLQLIDTSLRLEFERGPRGAVSVDVEARPDPGRPTLVRTQFKADPSHVPRWLASLDAVLEAYPPAMVVDGRTEVLADRDAAALESDPDAVVQIDAGCLPEAAISGPVLLQSDYRAFLTFNAVRERPDGLRENAGTAVVEIKGYVCTTFGYPNDEARRCHPLYRRGLDAHGYAVYEVLRSSWVSRLEAQNRRCFPNTGTWRARHFVVTMHESTFECLADDLDVRVVEPPHDGLYMDLVGRLWEKAPAS